MVERFDVDARRRVTSLAAEEAAWRGDRRIGTDHLLLALLHEPDSLAARTLGVDLDSARAASVALDQAALAAVGIDVGQLSTSPVLTRRRPPFTSGGRAILEHAVTEARAAQAGRIDARHLLLGVLSRECPDPAADLLKALGIDPAEARNRLAGTAY